MKILVLLYSFIYNDISYMTDGSGIDHREYNKSNEEADRLGKEAWSMCRLLFLEESMKELELKYGCNPNQKPAKVFMEEGELPFTVLNGKPGYINLLDAFNSWQLVKELKEATHMSCAASFKHVSPAGVAIGTPLTEVERQMYFVKESAEVLSPIANAYIKARGSDRMSSYGDFCALSDVCDEVTAKLINREVSDGIIAPGYTKEALEILKKKRRGTYCVLQMDPHYVPNPVEIKQVFGITFQQGRNNCVINEEMFKDVVSKNKDIPEHALHDLIISMITLKYTQSNSVCYVKNGQAIGIGAGQQSRIHCTRLAGNKADVWFLRQHPKVLGLQFADGLKRAEKDNTIDAYVSDDYEYSCADFGLYRTTVGNDTGNDMLENITTYEEQEKLAKEAAEKESIESSKAAEEASIAKEQQEIKAAHKETSKRKVSVAVIVIIVVIIIGAAAFGYVRLQQSRRKHSRRRR